jgi:hypothetical protein
MAIFTVIPTGAGYCERMKSPTKNWIVNAEVNINAQAGSRRCTLPKLKSEMPAYNLGYPLPLSDLSSGVPLGRVWAIHGMLYAPGVLAGRA